MITKISNIKFAQPIQLESKKQQVEQAKTRKLEIKDKSN